MQNWLSENLALQERLRDGETHQRPAAVGTAHASGAGRDVSTAGEIGESRHRIGNAHLELDPPSEVERKLQVLQHRLQRKRAGACCERREKHVSGDFRLRAPCEFRMRNFTNRTVCLR